MVARAIKKLVNMPKIFLFDLIYKIKAFYKVSDNFTQHKNGLSDPSIFGIDLNTFHVYYLSADKTIFDNNFLAVKWVVSNNLSTMRFTQRAARYGNLQCLKYLGRQSYEWNSQTCYEAAKRGHLNCLQYLHEEGCTWNGQTCWGAAENDHLDCLRYAHENGCEWGVATCESAAENGHLGCLIYLHENGCPWNWTTCESAAFNGHPPASCRLIVDVETCFDGLYVHENGCPWDYSTCWSAARYGHLDTLKYAIKEGCPYNIDYKSVKDPNVLSFLRMKSVC